MQQGQSVKQCQGTAPYFAPVAHSILTNIKLHRGGHLQRSGGYLHNTNQSKTTTTLALATCHVWVPE